MGLIINPRQIIKDGITSLRDVWSSSKVSAELSGKQATLVSGTNIKTINNTSLLGSGDITISGGGGDIPKINMTATTATLEPNKFYVWGEVASLDISLAAETAGIQNVYKFQFQSGATATTLTLPNNVSIDGDYPNAIKTTYIVSIESNIAKIERKRKEAILPPEYQQVEYLESTGAQYINTGISGKGSLTVAVTLIGNTNTRWGFGSKIAANNQAYSYGNGGMNGTTYGDAFCNYGNNYYAATDSRLNDGLLHTYTLDKGIFMIDDDVLLSKSQLSFDNSRNIFLCAINGNNNPDLLSYKLIDCNIYEQDSLIAQMYPCYRKADGERGVYDLIRNQFFSNAGTGNFIVGPDV